MCLDFFIIISVFTTKAYGFQKRTLWIISDIEGKFGIKICSNFDVIVWNISSFVFYFISGVRSLRGKGTTNQTLACFVCYLKIINTFFFI